MLLELSSNHFDLQSSRVSHMTRSVQIYRTWNNKAEHSITVILQLKKRKRKKKKKKKKPCWQQQLVAAVGS